MAKPARLTRRADFLAAQAGAKAGTKGFTLQMRPRGEAEAPPRVGFTASRKTGTAVERNRIRRRLRAAIREAGDAALANGHDYVLVAKRDTLHVPFTNLIADLTSAIRRVHDRGPPRRRPMSETAAP